MLLWAVLLAWSLGCFTPEAPAPGACQPQRVTLGNPHPDTIQTNAAIWGVGDYWNSPGIRCVDVDDSGGCSRYEFYKPHQVELR
jgi:hypothetical protein